MIGRSERTVRQWFCDFLEHGEIPDNKQGKYQQTGVLWSSEELNQKATKFFRERGINAHSLNVDQMRIVLSRRFQKREEPCGAVP